MNRLLYECAPAHLPVAESAGACIDEGPIDMCECGQLIGWEADDLKRCTNCGADLAAILSLELRRDRDALDEQLVEGFALLKEGVADAPTEWTAADVIAVLSTMIAEIERALDPQNEDSPRAA